VAGQRLDAVTLHQESLILGAPIEFLIRAPAKQRRRARGNADVEWERRQKKLDFDAVFRATITARAS